MSSDSESLSIELPNDYELQNYTITKVMGKGGADITYLATENDTDRRVVIKENYPTQFSARNINNYRVGPAGTAHKEDYIWALASFLDEAKILTRLNHPNIVRVLTAFKVLGTAYYVMDYIGGHPLHEVAPAPQQMTEEWLLGILRPMLSALGYIHSRPEILLHRDIKPSNILVDPEGTPILIDFGATRSVISTRTHSKMGTPGYAPHEQWSGSKKCGPWTDLYALGATCYYLIVGEAPPDCQDRMPDDCYNPLAPRPELRGQFSPTLLASIDKALSLRADARWQSAQDWLDELTADERTEAEANTRNELAQLRTALADALEHGQQTESKLKSAEKALQIAETTAANLLRQLKNAAQGNTGKRRSYGGCLIISLLLLAASGALNYHQYQYAESLSTQTENVKNELMQAEEKANKAEEAADAQYRKGLSFYEQQDYTKAVEWFQKAANQGDASAQCYLGFCYEKGHGVQQDYTKAVEWYKKSAEQGQVNAQFNLGVCYERARGVQQDYTKAVEWYKKAANQGYADAQFNLGVCYERSRGVQQNYTKAVEWFQKAANQGYADAQCSLGVCYGKGYGVQQDYTKAVEWFQKAAEQGQVNAQFNLGVCYERGRGVQQDYTKAVEWYKKSANQGNADAQFNLGVCYEYGLGVQKNIAQAIKWYRKASQQGNEYAGSALKRLER